MESFRRAVEHVGVFTSIAESSWAYEESKAMKNKKATEIGKITPGAWPGSLVSGYSVRYQCSVQMLFCVMGWDACPVTESRGV